MSCLMERCCSHARGGAEAGPAGVGRRLRPVAQGPGDVRGAAPGAALPPSFQDEHRPRGAAPLQGLLFQSSPDRPTSVQF